MSAYLQVHRRWVYGQEQWHAQPTIYVFREVGQEPFVVYWNALAGWHVGGPSSVPEDPEAPQIQLTFHDAQQLKSLFRLTQAIAAANAQLCPSLAPYPEPNEESSSSPSE